MTPSDERVGRLPKWARSYIEGLENRVDGVVDLSPGAVNFVAWTRREAKAEVKRRPFVYTIDAEEWQRLNRSMGK